LPILCFPFKRDESKFSSEEATGGAKKKVLAREIFLMSTSAVGGNLNWL